MTSTHSTPQKVREALELGLKLSDGSYIFKEALSLCGENEDTKRMDWLEKSTDGCTNSVVLVHNFSRYGSCRAMIDHALSIEKDAARNQGGGK